MTELSPPATRSRLRSRGGWLLYLAVLSCPVGKLAILAVAGGVFGLTLDSPYIVGGVLLGVITAGGLLARRVIIARRTSVTRDGCRHCPRTRPGP